MQDEKEFNDIDFRVVAYQPMKTRGARSRTRLDFHIKDARDVGRTGRLIGGLFLTKFVYNKLQGKESTKISFTELLNQYKSFSKKNYTRVDFSQRFDTSLRIDLEVTERLGFLEYRGNIFSLGQLSRIHTKSLGKMSTIGLLRGESQSVRMGQRFLRQIFCESVIYQEKGKCPYSRVINDALLGILENIALFLKIIKLKGTVWRNWIPVEEFQAVSQQYFKTWLDNNILLVLVGSGRDKVSERWKISINSEVVGAIRRGTASLALRITGDMVPFDDVLQAIDKTLENQQLLTKINEVLSKLPQRPTISELKNEVGEEILRKYKGEIRTIINFPFIYITSLRVVERLLLDLGLIERDRRLHRGKETIMWVLTDAGDDFLEFLGQHNTVLPDINL